MFVDLSVGRKQSNRSPEIPQDTFLLSNFLSDIDMVTANIGKIREATNFMEELLQTVIEQATTSEEFPPSDELEPLIMSTKKKAAVTYQLLHKLRDQTVRLKKSSAISKIENSHEIRMCDTLTNTAINKYVEVMREHQNAQTTFREELKKKVKLHYQIIKPTATTEEIDAIFLSNQGSSAAIRATILKVRVLISYFSSLK
jgi:t-SNARE complex subunit (syntaxin)